MSDQDIPFLDDTVARLPEDIRADMAEHGRRNLYYFAKGILGYRDMSSTCHKPLCEFFDHNPTRFKLVLHPRGTFKTSVGTIAKNMQRVVQDPNRRILIANETQNNAHRFLSAIRQHAESNKIFRTLYSEIIPKKPTRWSGDELEFVRQWRGPEPTLDCIGMTGAMTSRHYTHITIDDPISEEATKSEAVMQDVITRIDKVFSLMVKPEIDTFDLIGTRWALHDVYSHFLKRLGHRFAIYARGITFEGQSIFPELISLETLADIRSHIGEYMYSCLYMNNPRDVANQDFNINDVRFWRWSTDERSVLLYDDEANITYEWEVGKLDINVSVDLAVAEKITSDCNAIVTTGTTPDGRVVVLDTWVKRCTPLDVIEYLLGLKKRFNVRQFGIEGVAYQKAFKYFLKAECERRGEYMNIVELKAIPSKRGTGNNSKEMRIRGLQPIAAVGRLYVLPTQHELRSELADFPLGEHDDCIDALAHQLVMWRGLVSPARMARYKKSEDSLLVRLRQGVGGNILIGPGYDDGADLDLDEMGFHRFSTPQEYVMN